MIKKLGIVLCLSVSILFMACANNKVTKSIDNDTFKIGIAQFVQHEALDASNKGFIKALDDSDIKYVLDQQNAGGEISAIATIADKLVNNNSDLIFAIATPAAQAIAGVTTDIPIVITAVTDPFTAGLVESNERPGRNVTGSSDLTPVREQIKLLKKIIPNAKKVGMLYSSAEANSVFQIEIAHEAAKEEGLEFEDFTVSSLNEIQSVVESMLNKIDVIYVPTDNMIASGMSTVSQIASEHGIPIIGAEEAHVNNGALATYGIDYFELGYLAGKQAVEILKGEDIKEMPITYLPEEKFKLSVNEELAKTLDIDVSNIK